MNTQVDRPTAAVSRRRGRGAAIGAMALAAAMLLSACSSGASPKDDSGSTEGTGTGTLTYGMMGSANDQMTPYPLQRNVSQSVFAEQVYEGLTTYGREGELKFVLAESMDPNATLDSWTVHLRKGVKFHDGTDFDADDVVHSITWMLDPANKYPAASQIKMVDPAGVKKIDAQTVEIKLLRPYGPFPQVWTQNRLPMSSSDPKSTEWVGTGPWVVTAFTPQQEAKFDRFNDYWGEKPGFDHLDIVNMPDPAAMVNALRSGQIDIANSVPPPEIAGLLQSDQLAKVESESVGGLTLSMRTDMAPFDNPGVREAFRIMVDREQMLSNAYGGFGVVGNDMNTRATSCAAPDVPQRKQDIEKAKKLLADAGQSALTVDLVTDGMIPGMMESAQLFAQYAQEAGVTVNVRKLEVADFLAKYREWPFAIGLAGGDYFSMIPSYFQPGGEQNVTHFDDAEYNKLAEQLFATADLDKQCGIITQMLKIEWERGGDIVSVLANSVVVHNKRVVGLTPDRWGRAGYNFRGVTLEG